MQSEKIRPYFFLILLVGVAVLVAEIFAPFLKPLALAAVFTVVLQGLYNRILTFFGNRSNIAAFITVIVSVFLILLPLSLLSIFVGNEAHNLYVSLEGESGQSTVSQFFLRADEVFGGAIPELGAYARDVSVNIDAYTKNALQWIVANAGSIFSSISSLLLSFFIFFIALFYLLRDGKHVRQTLIKLSPLSDAEDEKVFQRLERAVNSVIRGNFMIALTQGVLTMIGFSLFGVANAVLWGTVAAVAALIPGIGTGLVFLPAIALLLFVGAVPQAIGLFIWGALAVGLVDNLLGPKLIGKGMQIHPLLVLLAVIGGLMFFGPVGIFLGPLSLSFLFALLSIYINDAKTI